jgi:hypothetical protein
MDAISWYALGRTVSDSTTIMEEIDDKILTHNLDGSAHGQSNEAVYNHRIAELLDHVSYSIYNVKVNPAARIYKAIVGPGFEADFSTIQAAIDWAHLYNGGIVHVKAGTYVQTGDITLYDNITFQGEDADTTILDFNGGAYQVKAIGTSGTHLHNIELRNIQIHDVDHAFDFAVKFEYADDCVIERVLIDSCMDAAEEYTGALLLSHCKRPEVVNNRIVNCDNGIEIDTCTNPRIHENYLQNITTMGLILHESPNSTIRNNFYDTQTNNAVDAYFWIYGSNNDSVIDGNFFNDIMLSCIWFADGSKVSITNNVILGTGDGADGIQCHTIDKSIISGNRIEGFFADGIMLYTDADYNTIVGNVITNNGGYGVYIVNANCNKNVVVANVLMGNSSGPISDSGTGTVYANNAVP